MRDHPLVLVVEDDVEMNELQRELLAVHGLEAVAAYTGTQAMAVQHERHADAVLMDVMLPEMDGFEATRQLKREDDVPVVIVTALDSDDCRRHGYEAGADAYFAKPFDPNEVIDTIRHLIQTHEHAGNHRK